MKKLVYYSAPWCQPCKMFGPVVEKYVEDNNLQLIKIDVDQSPQIAIDNQITSIPVLLLMEGTDVIKRIDGAKPRPFLDKNLTPLI